MLQADCLRAQLRFSPRLSSGPFHVENDFSLR